MAAPALELLFTATIATNLTGMIANGPMGEMQMSIKVTTSTKRTTEAEAAPKKAAVKEETVKEEAGKQGK